MSDQELAAWLDGCLTQKHRVAYVTAGYLCKLVDLDDTSLVLHPADPESKAKSSLKKLAQKGLLYCLHMGIEALHSAHTADNSWAFMLVQSKSQVDVFLATRDGLLGRTSGRGPEISEKTAQKVWADAGARCMFEGCAHDLSEIALWTKAARVGYLAHIVASDPEGPRGSQADSHRLANVPDNIMLMCDEHHRLIDSFAPQFYTAEILNEMRQSHRDIVRNYLNSLAFPRIKAVTLHANLANVPTYFHDSELIEAIVATRRAMEPGVVHYVRRRSQRDDRHLPEFWYQYLREHEHHIRELVTGFNSSSGLSTENLAIFPLHHIPTLVLAGRVMGEAQAIQVFQYDKVRKTWAWDPKANPPLPGTFNVSPLPAVRADEVLITLELSATLDEDALSPEFRRAVDSGEIPWIRVTTSKTGADCIGCPEDLEQFSQAARKAIVHAQDVMRAAKVHLIAISPASTVFRFGQMLQAGHHPEYVVYDRAGRDFQFVPALSITGHHVSATHGQQSITIPLR
ncbi:SAVED domain-containing protein [Pseudomonas pudica]|uniref:SAVED domain-containing protein n=1 Tax=Pseudomonas pudica TaxID=272772 RepID=UPI001E2F9F3F|nr:SAVED domain-containing protein [Pseudomonas pudica]